MQGIEPPYTDPYVRWCERSTSQLMASLLLDWNPRGVFFKVELACLIIIMVYLY